MHFALVPFGERALRRDRFDRARRRGRLAARKLAGRCEDETGSRLATCERVGFQPDEQPPRLLNGNDLIAMGFEPGPRIGEVLRALETAQLEGEVATREDAIDWVKDRARPSPNSV